MRILILGGTRFVGRAITEAFVNAGHDVTLFNRGSDEIDITVRRLRGDRNDPAALAPIGEQAWDAVVDVSAYIPAQVRSVLSTLGAGNPHYLYISTVSVYAESIAPGADESAPLLAVAEDIPREDPRSYGGLKALCERVLRSDFRGPLTVLRPTVVIGPRDYTDRFGWWVRAVADGGALPAPARLDQPVQLVDARDLAAFTLHCAESQAAQTYNVVGPRERLTLGSMIDELRAAFDVDIELREAGTDEAQHMPLTLPQDGSRDAVFTVSNGAALDAGLQLRPLSQSALDVLAWEREREAPRRS